MQFMPHVAVIGDGGGGTNYCVLLIAMDFESLTCHSNNSIYYVMAIAANS